MNITELVSVVSSGCKVDEIKEISALGVGVADAIKLSKAGLTVDDIKSIVSAEEPEKKDEPDKKEEPEKKDDPEETEKDKEIAKLKDELEKAQKANINKGIETKGEKDAEEIARAAISNW